MQRYQQDQRDDDRGVELEGEGFCQRSERDAFDDVVVGDAVAGEDGEDEDDEEEDVDDGGDDLHRVHGFSVSGSFG